MAAHIRLKLLDHAFVLNVVFVVLVALASFVHGAHSILHRGHDKIVT